MENEIVQLYLIVKDLGTQLGRVPEGGPDWKVVRDKAKELESLADEILSREWSQASRRC